MRKISLYICFILVCAINFGVRGQLTAPQMSAHCHLQLPEASSSQEITQVEGEISYYNRVSYGWYIYAGGNNLQYGPITGASHLVDATDGYCYLFDPLTADKHNTYIRCTRQGDKLVAQFPQVLATLENITGPMPLYIGMMHAEISDEGITYMPDDDGSTATWTINADGTITLDMPEVPLTANGAFADGVPQTILGTYYYLDSPEGVPEAIWNAVGDWAQTYTPIYVQSYTTIPDGCVLEDWQLTTKKSGRMVKVAFDGNEMYIANLTDYAPGAIKGRVKGGKVFFNTRQYMGFNTDYSTNVWFLSAKAVYGSYDFGDYVMTYIDHFDRTESLTFVYDTDKKTLTTEANDCYIINSTETETNFYEYQENPCLTYLSTDGMDAAPRDPVITVEGRDDGDDGYYFECEIPFVNVNGVTLNTDQLYYNIFLNGELYTFYTDTYPHFRENLTDIPYNYTDNWDLVIKGQSRGIYIHAAGIEEIAVQSVFVGSDGTLYKSERVSTRPAPTGHTVFAYAAPDTPYEPSGTGKTETYDVAIALTNPALEGKNITSIDIPVLPCDRVSNLSVWIADQLKLELIDGKNTNVVNRRVELDMPSQGDMCFVHVELDRPYTIPEGGTYVGYSLTVDAVSNVIPESLVPIVTAKGVKEGSFYLHTSRTFLNWQDRSAELGVISLIQVWLNGDFMINAASLGETDIIYAGVDAEIKATIPVHNLGMEPISTLDYTSTIDGKSASYTATFDTPIPVVFAYAEDVEFSVPSVDKTGAYSATIVIDKVNGMPNDTETSTQADVRVVKFVPEHQALVEEFTGTWCGWCPRGYVAMEYMRDNYPDFIGIAYHDKDPMYMKDGYPVLDTGFPTAAINRSLITDPYYAKGEAAGFMLPDVWKEYSAGFCGASVKVDAHLDGDKVIAVSEVEWVTDADPNADYRVEYVLLADGLTGREAAWMQHNYYATQPMTPLLENFCGASSYVPGLTFNDVAVLTSGTRGVEGSITDTSADHANVYTYTFDLNKVINYVDAKIPIDHSKLRVVAILLDMNKGNGYGEVVNAAKCTVDVSEGISDASIDARIVKSIEFFDLQGRQISRPESGTVCIMRTIYTDGTSSVTRLIRK